MTKVLEPVDEGTKLTMVLDIEPGYGILGKAILVLHNHFKTTLSSSIS